jgi:hypothetical protein
LTFPFLLQREDDDDEDDSVDQEPPYQSLTSPSGMKRYGTLASLDMLDDKEQVAEDSTDSEDHCEWDSDIDEGECNKKQEESCEYCDFGPFHAYMLQKFTFHTFKMINIYLFIYA